MKNAFTKRATSIIMSHGWITFNSKYVIRILVFFNMLTYSSTLQEREECVDEDQSPWIFLVLFVSSKVVH